MFVCYHGKREYRENDYLWGRLDSAERIIGMLMGDTESGYYKQAFKATMKEESPDLGEILPMVKKLNEEIDKL